MDTAIYFSLFLLFYFVYKTYSSISKVEKNSFEIFLPKENIRAFRFENLHKKVFLSFLSISLSLFFIADMIYYFANKEIDGELKRIEKISKRVLVYTTDGRYGIAFKKEKEIPS